MYQLAGRLDPDSIYDLSRFAFAELARHGVTAVGEFHYVQHDPKGQPYADRIAMADAVVRAARDVGLRITLLRVLYQRGGFGRGLDEVQRRFSDPEVGHALADADAIAARFESDEGVRVGLAPHSVRAAGSEWLEAARDHCEARGWPLHMHVSEQPRENQECLAEHGLTPVGLLERLGLLSERFVAVHATHLRRSDVASLASSGATACICRTTERDLGDGAPDLSALVRAGVKLSVGVDSHAQSDPFEELRAVELDERTRLGQRQVALDGPALLEAGSTSGYACIGQALQGDRIWLDANDFSLGGDAGVDGIVFGANGRAVQRSRVLGADVVMDGRVPHQDAITAAFRSAVARLS